MLGIILFFVKSYCLERGLKNHLNHDHHNNNLLLQCLVIILLYIVMMNDEIPHCQSYSFNF